VVEAAEAVIPQPLLLEVHPSTVVAVVPEETIITSEPEVPA
jgi:hypothetical protein